MALESTRDIIAELVAGRVEAKSRDCIFNGICTRVSDIRGGEMFVSVGGDPALELAAFERGASLLLTNSDPALRPAQIHSERVLQVEDAEAALWTIATWWLAKRKVPLLVVSGGPGKTIAKEFVARILLTQGRGCCTRASQNSGVDAAETLCRIGEEDAWCVLECASASLADLSARNIEPQSLVLIAGSDLTPEQLNGIAGGTTLIVPVDDAGTPPSAANMITYGFSEGATVLAKNVAIQSLRGTSFTIETDGKQVDFTMTLPGRHIARNAAAAIAAALTLFPGCPLTDIAESLRFMHPLPGRLHVHRLPENRYLFDDTEHATLYSLQPLLDLGRECIATGASLACVIGTLDEGGEAEHRESIRQLCELGPTALVVLGEYSTTMLTEARAHGVRAMVAASPQVAAHTVRKFPYSVLFVKGGSKLKLDLTVVTILETEGEVLEIPEGLTHFGAGEHTED